MPPNKILIVDDEKLIRWSINQKLSEWNIQVIEAEDGASALRVMEAEHPDLVILDVNLPDTKGLVLLKELKKQWAETPIIMITAYGSIDEAVSAMRSGAYDFLIKPIDYIKLESTINNALETASLKKKVAYYQEKEKKEFDLKHMVAESQVMKTILDITKTIAGSETSIVLLQGESGTGKDLIAQAVHYLSRRSRNPFLIINCSAIPETLLESELFGYEKGAFTDAKNRKRGLVELAHGGSLFLDEIGTLSLALQAKLLRFLETQTFKRIGSLRDIEVDVRVIAATNQNLEEATEAGNFRNDLFYRLNVCPIYIPPLRERPEDILPLAAHFIQFYNLKFRKSIRKLEKNAENLFISYNWPGNVRELRNAIERAMIFETGALVTTQHLPIGLNGKTEGMSLRSTKNSIQSAQTLEEMEKKMLQEALKKARGNKSEAARNLGITRDTLRYKLKKWGLS